MACAECRELVSGRTGFPASGTELIRRRVARSAARPVTSYSLRRRVACAGRPNRGPCGPRGARQAHPWGHERAHGPAVLPERPPRSRGAGSQREARGPALGGARALPPERWMLRPVNAGRARVTPASEATPLPLPQRLVEPVVLAPLAARSGGGDADGARPAVSTRCSLYCSSRILSVFSHR